MSQKPIDKLFRSGFRTKKYVYKDAYWNALYTQIDASQKSKFSTKLFVSLALVLASIIVSSDNKIQEKQVILLAHLDQAETDTQNAFSVNKKEASVAVSKAFQKPQSHSYKKIIEVENKQFITTVGRNQNVKTKDTDQIQPEYVNSVKKSLKDNLDNGTQNINNLEAQPNLSLEPLVAKSLNNKVLDKRGIISVSPIKDRTAFGVSVAKAKSQQFFIQGGAYYLALNSNTDMDTPVPEGFDTEVHSYSYSGGELLFGLKKRRLKLASGIGVSITAKTYRYNFEEEQITRDRKITSSTYLESVDSSFSHYEIKENKNSTDENFYIANAIYNVDSNFVSISDTNIVSSSKTKEYNVPLAYNLNHINIPIQIGYEIDVKQFFIDFNATLRLGILTNYNGFAYQKNSEELRSVITKKDLNPLTLKYVISAGVGYNLNHNISIIAQPIYSSTLIGAFKKQKPQNNVGFGGNLALRYKF